MRQSITTFLACAVMGVGALAQAPDTTASRTSSRFSFEDPNHTRLLFAPTARKLDAWKGYVADYEIVFLFASVGTPINLSISGGSTIVPGSSQILYFAPKFTAYETEDLAVAGGVLLLSPTDNLLDGDFSSAGLAYAVATYGKTDASVTVGLASGYVNGRLEGRPFVMVGGEKRLTNHIKIVSENYLTLRGLDENAYLAGLRFLTEFFTVDLGAVLVPSVFSGPIPGFPWIGVAFTW